MLEKLESYFLNQHTTTYIPFSNKLKLPDLGHGKRGYSDFYINRIRKKIYGINAPLVPNGRKEIDEEIRYFLLFNLFSSYEPKISKLSCYQLTILCIQFNPQIHLKSSTTQPDLKMLQ